MGIDFPLRIAIPDVNRKNVFYGLRRVNSMHSALFQQGTTILLLIGWALVTIGVGRLCLVPLSLGYASRAESLFLSGGAGLTVIGYAVFLLGVMDSLQALPLSLLLALSGLAALAGWRRALPILKVPAAERSPLDHVAAVFLVLVLLAGFFLTLTPETGKDALIYHLAVPKLYLARHGFFFIPGNVFAGYPLLGEMHYLLALFLKDDTLARAMHFALLCGTLLGIGQLIRFEMRENAFPALAMLVFATIPSVFAVSHLAYNDLFVAFFTLAAVYTFLRWSKTGARGWITLCGVFSGSAAACKYTALLMPPLAILGILLFSYHQRKETAQVVLHISVFALAAAITACPFYLKSWIMTGNPVYPFFYDLFGGRGWDPDQARLYDIFINDLGMGRTWLDYLLIPWNLSFRAEMDSPRFDGILGPVFILTLPFVLGKRRWEAPVKTLLIYSFLTFLFWASSAQQIRYLIPLLSLSAILVGSVLTKYRRRRMIFVLLLLVLCGSLAYNGWHMVRDFIRVSPLPVVVGSESREAFLTRMIPSYPMYRFVNHELPRDSRVFLIYMKNFTFLCERSCYADAMFEAHTLQKILRKAASPDDVRERLKKAGFTHLLYDETYLLGEPSPLSPEEKRLFRAFQNTGLVVVTQQGPYRLERLRETSANLPLIR